MPVGWGLGPVGAHGVPRWGGMNGDGAVHIAAGGAGTVASPFDVQAPPPIGWSRWAGSYAAASGTPGGAAGPPPNRVSTGSLKRPLSALVPAPWDSDYGSGAVGTSGENDAAAWAVDDRGISASTRALAAPDVPNGASVVHRGRGSPGASGLNPGGCWNSGAADSEAPRRHIGPGVPLVEVGPGPAGLPSSEGGGTAGAAPGVQASLVQPGDLEVPLGMGTHDRPGGGHWSRGSTAQDLVGTYNGLVAQGKVGAA
jgi:hypothetical protein